MFNLDQLRFDAQVVGDGTCQLYIWVTDDRHHWFQQRLALIPGDGRWRTVIADFSDDAPWEGMVSGSHWGPPARRRVRRLGLLGFFHGAKAASASTAAPTPLLRIDHVCRYGWPTTATPTATIQISAAPAEQVALYEPLAADFHLNVETRNPYDPEQADVVGEVEGPGGISQRWPAYWAEPMRLEFHDGVERARCPMGRACGTGASRRAPAGAGAGA